MCPVNKKLFVGGLSFDTTDISLRDGFARFGEVVEAKVILAEEKGASGGGFGRRDDRRPRR